eukprot:CAMPEP_0196758138 /NCGR_PEP_ID=MMETSP1091-20130531/104028_1 /TAXON_ID=302021 /ORGANISM="Rhodomonas sp., Strain CCMP768" /LENGTH=673 /DNA_ID=CAMNT_0042106941 /DNA_START=15 /DNA_END=2036 /DNA_ORIENTATION=-
MRSPRRLAPQLLQSAIVMVVPVLVLLAPSVDGCTTVLATKDATEDGSSLAAHSNDGEGTTDPRLVVVPAADHEDGAMREIHYALEEYPRYMDKSRGVKEYFPTGNQTVRKPIGHIPQVPHTYKYFEETYGVINEKQVGIAESKSRRVKEYYPTGNQTARKPIGHIPQVPHTYKYFEETYGVINEKQVGIAESTCSGIFGAKAAGHGGTALMSVDTLSQLAMERAKTAREAVELMGAMAEKYGFYGAGSFEGTAESLLVIDPHEGWVFHILPDPTGTSAIWVAQRVPDGHVTVVPNIFVIRVVDLDDDKNFVGSRSMFDIAKERGLWTPGTPFDFTAIFSEGEYVHKYYCGRRLWRAYSLLDPSQEFPSEYDDLRKASPYPFSIAPHKKVSLKLVMAVMRDYLQGTTFDLTRGIAAGPFGTPDRYNPGKGEAAVSGAWERPIALFRTSDSYVVQARGWLPDEVGGVVWFGPHGAHGTCYVPFPIGMAALPHAYTVGDPRRLSRHSAYWAHRYVENLANLRWRDMIGDVQSEAEGAQRTSLRLLAELEHVITAPATLPGGAAAAREQLTRALTDNAEDVVRRWWALADHLMEKYADGNVLGASVGYPAWWLEQVGYKNGPQPIPGYHAVSYPPAPAVPVRAGPGASGRDSGRNVKGRLHELAQRVKAARKDDIVQ